MFGEKIEVLVKRAWSPVVSFSLLTIMMWKPRNEFSNAEDRALEIPLGSVDVTRLPGELAVVI